MSEFVFLLRSDEENYQEAMGTPARAQKSLQAWVAWLKELEAQGQLKNPGIPLERSGKTVRGKALAVTDGPFTEAKEAIASFALVEVRSKEEAIELGRRFRRIVGDGQSTIQQVFSA